MGGRLVLARLLGPADFGRFTLALVVVAAAEAACQLQLHQPLVHRRTVPPALMATAYWTQSALGGAGTLLLLAAAEPLAALTGQSGVAPLIRGLSPLLAIGGLAAVPRAWLWRTAAFRQLAGRELASEAAGLAAGLGAAGAGAGAWSLVVLELVRAATELACLRWLIRWRPRRTWSRESAQELLGQSWPLLGQKVADVVFAHADRLLVGRLFGAETLGLYALALRVVEALAEGIGAVFAQVGLPLFARTQRDATRSRRGLLEATRAQALLAAPPVLGLALLAPELVPLLLGSAWGATVPLVRALACRALLVSLTRLPHAALLGRGRPRLLLGLGVLRLGVFTLGWGLGLRWGPLGVAVGGAGAAAALLVVTLHVLARSLPVTPGAWGRAVLPAAVGSVAMALTVIAAGHRPELLPGDPWARSAALATAAVLGYVLPLSPWLSGEWRRFRAVSRTRPRDPDPAARSPDGAPE